MLSPQFSLPIHHELIVDLFAGGGGASTGIEMAVGRPPDIAVNHDPDAISLHTANHPQTKHFCSDVFEVDPIEVCQGQPVALLWASPSCTHFSKARGGNPVNRQLRSLAWVVVRWAAMVKPRVIFLENVEEFRTWGPIANDGRPCPQRKGKTFNQWKAQLEALGYRVEHRELRACDYGAPTIRKRLFLIARRDGFPISWPDQTHSKPDASGKVPSGLKSWRTAAECIDWSLPCPSIFTRSKPLADATCRRIAKGIMRYVVNAAEPFIVQYHSAKRDGERQPLPTQTTENRFALVTAFLAKHYTGVVGSDLSEPIGTVTSIDHHSLVSANLVHLGHGEGKDGTKRFSHGIRSVEEPLNTITASGAAAALVHAFLVKYYGNEADGVPLIDPMHTIPTKDRLGLVTVIVAGEKFVLVDIGLRMLTPAELFKAQGFPDNYIIDRGADGKPLTKTAQVRLCGNSVCPPIAAAIVAANYSEIQEMEIAA